MYTIKNIKDSEQITDNLITINKNVVFNNSFLEIHGINNHLVIEDGSILYNSSIFLFGNNSYIYLSKCNYAIKVEIYNNSEFFCGKKVGFNGVTNFKVSESKNIYVGNDCLFSYGISVRTSDAHLIYDLQSRKRLNHSESIVIGDHVWIGQNVTILKGTYIGSGCVIGASSMISKKKLTSNSIWAGNPVKQIRSNIYWNRQCTNQFTKDDSLLYEINRFKYYHYIHDNNSFLMKDISISKILNNSNSNRFSV